MNLNYCNKIIFLLTFFLAKYCSGQGSALRLMGGRDSVISEYPYIMRMETQEIGFLDEKHKVANKHFWIGFSDDKHKVTNKHFCTCAAISSIWTLTAAHCVVGIESVIKRRKATAKDLDIRAVLRYGSVRHSPLHNSNSFSNILAYIQHPRFMTNEDIHFYLINDIGLLKNDPILLKQYGKISGLDFSSLIGKKVIIVGFGLTNATQKRKNPLVNTLKLKKPLQVSSVLVKKCDKYDFLWLYPIMCTAKPCGQHVSICPGDSGGPVLHDSKIIAVNSAGPVKNACMKEYAESCIAAGYMTPVSPFIDWITSNINTKD